MNPEIKKIRISNYFFANNKTLFFLVFLISFLACGKQEDAPLVTKHKKYEGNPSATVQIRKIANRYQFFRNGAPYYVKGACGDSHLALLKEIGGNSIRTYTTFGMDTLLDQAQALGLTVMVGLWVDREIENFDYNNRAAVKEQKERLRAIVNKYKDHPAVLCWGIGNEPGNAALNTEALWPALNDIAGMIHELDPNHPVTIPCELHYAMEVFEKCPNLDFISVNTAGDVSTVQQTLASDIPYLICEWTCLGYWEASHTDWQVALEESVPQKYENLKNIYQYYITPDSSNSMGSYVFLWGQKQEHTPTWFSMFTEQGDKTPLVDLLFELWNGKPYAGNLAPFLDSLIIDRQGAKPSRYLSAGKVVTASVRSSDPENDSLQYSWEIFPDNQVFEFDKTPGKGWIEIRPQPLPNLLLAQKENQINFRIPLVAGPYRLLVYARDGHGNGSYANMPFYVVNNSLTSN